MAHARRIVVGVDGSSLSKEALRWALVEARLRDAAVDAVCTWDYPVVALSVYGTANLPVAVAEDLEHAADATLHKALAEIGAHDVEVNAIVDHGPAALALTKKAEGADLVVVGSRGHGGFAGMLLGSVSRAVLHEASSPVVVVPGPLPAIDAAILVGVDGSPSSAAALRWAVDEARRRGTTVDVVHAWQYPGPIYYGETVAFTADDVSEASAQVLSEMMTALGDTGDVKVASGLERGHPVDVLARRSEQASLVVVGSRGHGALTSMVLGSTSSGVVRHSQCPTVVVHWSRADTETQS